jgi:hypothetical protein
VPIEAPVDKLTLENLTAHYERLAAQNPDDADIGRTLRFLHFLCGNDAASLEAIGGLPPEDQRLWHWLMASMIAARERTPGMSRADQAAEILEDLDQVQMVLKEQAPLELGEVRFCRQIRSFGNYEPLEVNRFGAGQQAELYAELRNFASTQDEDGLYRVKMNVALSLERSDGTSVWQQTFPDVEDTCRRPRQDFFLKVFFPIPADAVPGAYVLKITFEDAAAAKQAGARLELEVTSP